MRPARRDSRIPAPTSIAAPLRRRASTGRTLAYEDWMSRIQLVLLTLLACSAPKPPPAARGPLPCDVLPMLGRVEMRSLAADAEGGVAAAGEFRGTLRSGNDTVTSAGGWDIFVLRATPLGD